MSRARRQQRKRARRWSLEVRDTMFGWRASWWHNGREMHPAKFFPRVENRFNLTLKYPTGRAPSPPDLQRLPPRAAFARAMARTHRAGQAAVFVDVDFAGLEARITARMCEAMKL